MSDIDKSRAIRRTLMRAAEGSFNIVHEALCASGSADRDRGARIEDVLDYIAEHPVVSAAQDFRAVVGRPQMDGSIPFINEIRILTIKDKNAASEIFSHAAATAKECGHSINLGDRYDGVSFSKKWQVVENSLRDAINEYKLKRW